MEGSPAPSLGSLPNRETRRIRAELGSLGSSGVKRGSVELVLTMKENMCIVHDRH